tara:strand:- start:118 stop:651 length:534 start_codon:yes stop_codon:yes gene_type:complete
MIRKYHPKLKRMLRDEEKVSVQLGSENNMKELWDASNPDLPHELRTGELSYPIEEWFGTIVNDEGKARLVSVTGHTIRNGKENQPYALVGGNKTHPEFIRRRLMAGAREKNLSIISNMPKIAGYTSQGKASFSSEEQPDSHPIIPDEELDFFRDRVGRKEGVVSWSLIKQWKEILRI